MRPLPRKCGVYDSTPRAVRRTASEKRLCIANPGLQEPRTARDGPAEVTACADVVPPAQRLTDRVVAARFAARAVVAGDTNGGGTAHKLVITLAVRSRAHCRE